MSLTKPQLIEKTNVFVRENARRLITGRSFNELLLDFIETCFNDGSGGSSDLEVGVTPIVSGTSGRIFYQKSANTLGQSENLFFDEVNSRLSLAQGSSPGARLDVRAQGSLSSDLGFRLRNSLNTANIFSVSGSNQFIFGSKKTTPEGIVSICHDTGSPTPCFTVRNGQYENLIFQVLDERTTSTNSVGSFRMNGIINGGESGNTRKFDLGGYGLGSIYGSNAQNSVWLNQQGNTGDGQGTSVISVSTDLLINLEATKVFKFSAFSGNFGIKTMTFGNSATNTFAISNGTTPTTSIVDGFQQYSADITAGNAAPHFRTEGGNIIKLYTQDLPTTPTTAEIATLLSNLGFANLI